MPPKKSSAIDAGSSTTRPTSDVNFDFNLPHGIDIDGDVHDTMNKDTLMPDITASGAVSTAPAVPETPKRRCSSDTEGAPAIPSPRPSSKKRLRRLRVMSESGKPLQPGKAQNTKTFAKKIREKEGQTAAYLGYNRVDELRKFAISPIVLQYFNKLDAKDRTKSRLERVLEIIVDCPQDMLSEEEPATKYPRQHTASINFRVALIVVQTYRAIQKAQSERVQMTADEIESSVIDLEALVGQSFPRIRIDDILQYPEFGPFTNLGEDALERYARVYTLLRYIGHCAIPDIWRGRYGSDEWDLPTIINQSHVPHWMRPKDAKGSEPLAPDAPILPPALEKEERPAIVLPVTWKYKSKLPEVISHRAFIEDEELTLPDFTQTIKIEPEANRDQFLDSVRSLYDMVALRANIFKLSLLLANPDEDEEDTNFAITEADWDVVQHALWNTTWDSSRSAFSLFMRLAYDKEIIWQSKVPLMVQQVLTLKDGDVVSIQPETDIEAESASEAKSGRDEEGVVYALRSTTKERVTLDPVALFDGRTQDMLKFYDGHDPTTPAGLLAWQKASVKKLTHKDQRHITGDSAERYFGGTRLDKKEEEILDQAKQEGEQSTLALGDDTKAAQAHYYTLNQIHTGTSRQVGLPLRPCATALELEPFRDAKGKLMYRPKGQLFAGKAFFPWQVTGACSAIVGAFGFVPVRADAPREVKDAAASLSGLAIGGKMICDQTGLGKTVLLLINLYIARNLPELDADGKPYYRMMVLVVPAGVIKQWADEIITNWPELTLMISYDDTGLQRSNYQKCFVSATALKEYPDPKRWPAQFHYIFDNRDPKVASTVLLTSNETQVSRSLKWQWINYGVDADGEPITIKTPVSVLRGAVGRAAVDEGHKLKDQNSRRWKAFAGMDAPVNWIVGATPMSNTSSDFIAQLRLIWKGAKKHLETDSKAYDWVQDRRRSMRMFSDGEALTDPRDKRQLGFLHPATVRHLLEKGTKVEVARYFHLCEDLVCVKRFMGSKLPMDFNSDEVFDMKDSMEPYFFQTLNCGFRTQEESAHQFLHREASRRFLVANRNNQIKMQTARAFGASNKSSILYPVAEMRELLITSMSTKLRLFHDICKKMRHDTLVETLNEYRGSGFDGFRFVRFMCTKLKIALPSTALEYMEFICDGSPVLRNLLWALTKDDAFLKPRALGKFLITEDVPLNAMFLEWGLNMFGLNVAVFHSGLSQAERNELQAEFNDPDATLDGMIIMYDVGGYGLNFWRDCHQVWMCTPAKNESGEKQTGGRVIRAPQPHRVVITKLFVSNSIYAYREYRKRDKFLVELATRASDPAMQALIVKCLNDFQLIAKEAQADPANKELMQELHDRLDIAEDTNDLAQAGAVADPIDLVDVAAPTSKRVSKAPKRFADAKFVDGKPIYPGDDGYTDAEDDDGPLEEPRKLRRRKPSGRPVQTALSDEESEASLSPLPRRKQQSKKDRQDDAYEGGADTETESDVDSDDDFGTDDDSDARVESSESEAGEEDVQELTTAEKRKEKKKAFEAFHSEEQEDEGVRQLRLILSADTSRVYTVDDLQKEEILTRGLEITYCLRVGQRPDKVPSIHIRYDMMDHNLDDDIKKQVNIDESKALLKDILAAQKTYAPDDSTSLKAPPGHSTTPVDLTPSPQDGGSLVVDYSKTTVKKLKELAKKRNIRLEGATKKEDIIQLLKRHDHSQRQGREREQEKSRVALITAWARREFDSGSNDEPLLVPIYEDMSVLELEKRCAKAGLENTRSSRLHLVDALHRHNMEACAYLEYEEIPDLYLAQMFENRDLGDGKTVDRVRGGEDFDREDVINRLRYDDDDGSELRKWEAKYIEIDTTASWST